MVSEQKKSCDCSTQVPNGYVVAYRFAATGSCINADYLNLLKRALNIKLTLREYADHQKAMDALEEGEVDIVLSHLVASPPLNDDIAATKPLIITFRRWSPPFTIQCDRLPHQNQ